MKTESLVFYSIAAFLAYLMLKPNQVLQASKQLTATTGVRA
jgi:hypothetical protein